MTNFEIIFNEAVANGLTKAHFFTADQVERAATA
jgi:hypothetical protein